MKLAFVKDVSDLMRQKQTSSCRRQLGKAHGGKIKTTEAAAPEQLLPADGIVMTHSVFVKVSFSIAEDTDFVAFYPMQFCIQCHTSTPPNDFSPIISARYILVHFNNFR
jgi:hypothetical protein